MSTETGATKRRLSRSTSESEEGATDTATNKSSEDSDITKHADEQQVQHGSDKDETDNMTQSSGTRQEGTTDTAAAASATTSNTIQNLVPGDGSRQIIAVSANKNPTAFFQLARKFLMTNEMCDLSALEGAIVSAVDAARLLERSKLATIVRIHTSYVNVEPKRRRQPKGEVPTSETTTREGAPSTQTSMDVLLSSQTESLSAIATSNTARTQEKPAAPSTPSQSVTDHSTDTTGGGGGGMQQSSSTTKVTAATTRHSASSGGGGRELRRARILVTVKRTESYKLWLEENPIQRQAIIADTATVIAEELVGKDSSLPSSP